MMVHPGKQGSVKSHRESLFCIASKVEKNVEHHAEKNVSCLENAIEEIQQNVAIVKLDTFRF